MTTSTTGGSPPPPPRPWHPQDGAPRSTADPCPHPARHGTHELYLDRDRVHCRACGALDEPPMIGPKVSGGCEWNPRLDAPALETDHHHGSRRAELVVGADGRWHLCRECAALPAFKRLRVRRPLRARG